MNQDPTSDESHESLLIPLLDAARRGSEDTQNQLMEQLRSYFHLMAKFELSPELQHKIGQSDVVQQSCVRVIEAVEQFRGTTEGELRNWLKRILVNEVKQAGRDLRSQKRDVRREVPIAGDSHMGMPGLQPADSRATPGTDALKREKIAAIHTAISRLPEDYQQVIRLRNWQQLSFPEIAKRMNRSINATEKLWYRAVQRLRKEFGDKYEQSQ